MNNGFAPRLRPPRPQRPPANPRYEMEQPLGRGIPTAGYFGGQPGTGHQQNTIFNNIAPGQDIPNYPRESGGAPRATLADDYDSKVRPLIDFVDSLRRLGLDKDMGLPSIVVVGDQSAGKSSVLEAISGVQLPRGGGIVTRCPLELRLKRNKDVTWRAHIHFQNTSGQINTHDEIQRSIEIAQEAVAGKDKGISDEIITLEVESPSLPDLTLIDLPGITRVAVTGQDPRVVQQIKAMIHRYIKKPESIILAVVPANVDVATSEALKLAEEVDKPGNRTIGVVTKMDLVDKGGEVELQKVLDGERYPLKKGFIGVRCRSQQAINDDTSLSQAIKDEEAFFKNSAHFRDYFESRTCGVSALSSKLAEELFMHIQNELPRLEDNIRSQLYATKEKLNKMGDGVPADRLAKKLMLGKMLRKYTDELKNLADGHEDPIPDEFRLHKMARSHYEEFAVSIQSHVPQKRGVHTNDIYKDFIDLVEDRMDRDRGRELPGYMKFDTLKSLVWQVVSNFMPPAFKCLDKVSKEVHKRLDKLAKVTFEPLPKLASKMKSVVASVIHEKAKSGEDSVKEMFELEALVFSQSQTYMASLENVTSNKGQQVVEKKANVGFDNADRHRRWEAERMFTSIQAYLEICVIRVADLIPMIIMRHAIMQVVDSVREKVDELGNDDSTLSAIEESPDEARKRRQLVEKLDRLQKAQQELNRMYMYTRN